MKFSLDPPLSASAFEQWKDAMKAVARLPLGIPDEFRKKVSAVENLFECTCKGSMGEILIVLAMFIKPTSNVIVRVG